MPRRKSDSSASPTTAAGPSVTALGPLPRDPTLVVIELDGRRKGTLLRSTAEELRLAVGGRLDPSGLRRLDDAIALAAARSAALRWLGTRDRSSVELRTRLEARGHDATIAERAVAALHEDGWIDDDRYLDRRIASLRAKRPSSRTHIAARLEAEGIAPQPIRRALHRAGLDAAQDLSAAEELLRRRLRGAKDAAATRRAATALVRAGFEADTMRAAFGRLGLDATFLGDP